VATLNSVADYYKQRNNMTTDTHPDPDTDEKTMRLGPIRMVPGVRPINVITLFFASFFGIAVMSFMNASQPILLEEILGIPSSEHGRVSGSLTFWHEVVVLLCIVPIGAMSDRFGRRPFYMLAFLLIGIGHFLYPLADNENQLLMFRLVFAVGTASASAMLAAVANDYPQESGRARMIAITMFFNAIGMVIIYKFLQELQPWLEAQGYSTVEAITYVRWTAAAFCALVAITVIFGLKKGAPVQATKREPILRTMRIGFSQARNPRIALAYFAALVSRGDLAVVSTFFTLWLFTVGKAQDLSTTDAMARALGFYIVIQAAALPAAIVAGLILDKIDRLLGLAGAMVLGAVGYGSLVFVEDPLNSSAMYISAVLVGFAEITANLSSLSLVGKEAPAKGRGAVIGMFSLFGALGIMFVAMAGGYLFDAWRPTGPFALVAVANVVVFTLALLLYSRQRRSRASAA
jgi:MFS family permease